MIRRKKLVDYANSIKLQAYQCTKHNQNYIYLEAINALCQCGFAIRANKKANIEAFKISETHFDAEYQFGYEQFLNGTVESNMAVCYINMLSLAHINNIILDYDKIKPLDFYKVTNLSSIIMLTGELSSINNIKYINKLLFQLECLASTSNIDLHYFIDKTLENMIYNLKNNI